MQKEDLRNKVKALVLEHLAQGGAIHSDQEIAHAILPKLQIANTTDASNNDKQTFSIDDTAIQDDETDVLFLGEESPLSSQSVDEEDNLSHQGPLWCLEVDACDNANLSNAVQELLRRLRRAGLPPITALDLALSDALFDDSGSLRAEYADQFEAPMITHLRLAAQSIKKHEAEGSGTSNTVPHYSQRYCEFFFELLNERSIAIDRDDFLQYALWPILLHRAGRDIIISLMHSLTASYKLSYPSYVFRSQFGHVGICYHMSATTDKGREQPEREDQMGSRPCNASPQALSYLLFRFIHFIYELATAAGGEQHLGLLALLVSVWHEHAAAISAISQTLQEREHDQLIFTLARLYRLVGHMLFSPFAFEVSFLLPGVDSTMKKLTLPGGLLSAFSPRIISACAQAGYDSFLNIVALVVPGFGLDYHKFIRSKEGKNENADDWLWSVGNECYQPGILPPDEAPGGGQLIVCHPDYSLEWLLAVLSSAHVRCAARRLWHSFYNSEAYKHQALSDNSFHIKARKILQQLLFGVKIDHYNTIVQ